MKQLRKSMRVIALILVLMLLVPIGYGFYSLARYGTRWRTSEYNKYLTSMKSTVTAGEITDRHGVTLAATGLDGTRVYAGDATLRRAVVHVVGDVQGRVKNAAESFFAEYLYGANMGYFERLSQYLGTGGLRGDDIALTIDGALCKYILSIFPQDKSGAVVVMNYKTGEVYALMSPPGYDPAASGAVPLRLSTNRATRWLSAPGSAFKIITLAGALTSMPGVTERAFVCTGGVAFGEHERIVTDYAGTAHGELTLKNAFAQSCNSTFAVLALEMGDKALRRAAAAFGVGDDFTFRDLVVENSAFANADSALMGADLAWTGDGQHELGLTPMHLCMISCAVANDGVMMEPRLLLRARGASGAERLGLSAKEYRRALEAQEAAIVREYMRQAVATGTGARAAAPGLTICGKTGTAEIDTQAEDNAWFTGFIASDQYPFAVCVVVTEGGEGGGAAAPIAQKIFTYLAKR